MPLPIILGVGAALAGAAGVKAQIRGAEKMKDANDTMEIAESRHKRNAERFEIRYNSTVATIKTLDQLETEIEKRFEEFSDVIEKIQDRPQFKGYSKNGVVLPAFAIENLKSSYIKAGSLLSGLGGVIANICGKNVFSRVIIGGANLGMNPLVGGALLNFAGTKLSEKADEAYNQVKREELAVDRACEYMTELESVAGKYYTSLKRVNKKYLENFNYVSYVVNRLNKVEWDEFEEEEKIALENAVLLVGLLYKMRQVQLVRKSGNEMSPVNRLEIEKTIEDSEKVMEDVDEHFSEVKCQNRIQRQERWEEVKTLLRKEYFSTDIFERYIRDTLLVSEDVEKLRILGVDKKAALFLKENCNGEIKAAVREIYGCDKEMAYGYADKK